MIAGLDLGEDEGLVTAADWALVAKEGKRFVLHRCAQGLGGIDPTFAANVVGAKAAGLASGAYFVLDPDLDPAEQAEHHFALCSGLGTAAGELAPWADVELTRGRSPAEVLAVVLAWQEAAAAKWRRRVGLYTYEYFDHAELAGDGSASLASMDLAMAYYSPKAPAPPPPWSAVTWWQNSGGRAVAGVPVYRLPNGCPCDTDWFLGDEAAFAAACDPLANVVVPTSSET